MNVHRILSPLPDPDPKTPLLVGEAKDEVAHFFLEWASREDAVITHIHHAIWSTRPE